MRQFNPRRDTHLMKIRVLALCDGSKALVWLLSLNLALSLAAMAVWVVAFLTGSSCGWLRSALAMPGDPAMLPARPWTVATYMFTQFSPLHLLFNLLWLFWFGKILLLSCPSRRLVWLYIGGGVAGAAAFILSGVLGADPGWLVGSSASVMAVMTAAAVLMPDRHINFLLVGEVRLKWVAGAAVVLTFLGIGGGDGGAQSAHIAGVLYGLVCGLVWRRDREHGWRDSALRDDMTPPGHHDMTGDIARDGAGVAKALRARLEDRRRLDILLDKISTSGYESLSSSEREELRTLSGRL